LSLPGLLFFLISKGFLFKIYSISKLSYLFSALSFEFANYGRSLDFVAKGFFIDKFDIFGITYY